MLINLGKPNEATTVLDSTQQETAYQKYMVYQTLTKAFLKNNEAKSAQVCLNEAAKVWAEAHSLMGDTERKECLA